MGIQNWEPIFVFVLGFSLRSTYRASEKGYDETSEDDDLSFLRSLLEE